MSDPAGVASCCRHDARYCLNCDLLVGLDGLHVVAVSHDDDGEVVRVVVESPPVPMGCPACGVVAHSKGRRSRILVDVPCFGRAVNRLKAAWSGNAQQCGVFPPSTDIPAGHGGPLQG